MHGKITCLCFSPLNIETLKEETNISQEVLERVERYLDRDMSKQEEYDFELQMQSDASFRIQVESIKILLLGVENQSLKERLDEFHKDIPLATPENQAASGFPHWRKLAAAAVIVLAVSGFWWFSTPQNERLYTEYFTPDPGLPTVMGNSNNFDFYDAMVDYKQGHYQTAIEKWENLSIDNDTLAYFLGVAYLADKNQRDAIPFLEKATNNSSFPLLDDAYYYLGLAYLKEGNIEKAKKYLKLSTLENSRFILLKLDEKQ